MARIRRESTGGEKTEKLWRAGIYLRLSREDGADESYSVQNQRQRLLAHLEDLAARESIVLSGTYIDDGFTGTDSDREAFQRMLSDIDAGKINCVAVKDLSRLSRNDWECKRYLQHFFVARDVRFISLELPRLDSFKNPGDVYEPGVSIQSLYNENHCRETSIKVRGTFDMKRAKGEFIGAFPPYGYLKDPCDKHRLVVDEEAAGVVVDIFRMFCDEGMSKSGIVKRLNAGGVLSPSAYKRQKGMNYRNPSVTEGASLWSERSLTAILKNQVYLGHMVQGRQRVRSYKVHTRINTAESEWFVVENTHEPIVDEGLFQKAQELMRRDTRISTVSGQLHTFSGLLFCGDCGRAMVRRSAKGYVYYACRAYVTQGICSRHSIRLDRLEAAVLKALQGLISRLPGLEGLLEEIKAAPDAVSSSGREEKALRKLRSELERTLQLKTGLYEDWKCGELSREEYRSLKKEFEERRQALERGILSLEQAENGGEKSCPELEAFLERGNIKSLERSLLTELLSAIHIFEGGEIGIDLSFPDFFVCQ